MSHSIENKPVNLRDRLKSLRSAQDPAERQRGALLIRGRLFTWLATTREAMKKAGRRAPENIAAFWPLAQEPDLVPLLQQWATDEHLNLSLPVVTGENQPLEFRRWTPETPMNTGTYGIGEPVSEPAPNPDVILVPVLGFTREGDRVGYGKGYYDRTLAKLDAEGHRFIAIGVGWACGDLGRLPEVNYQPQAHDYPLDAILTDKGWAMKLPD